MDGMDVVVEEVTDAQAVAIAKSEIEKALHADSLDHMRMHLESATIWLRGVSADVVRKADWTLRA